MPIYEYRCTQCGEVFEAFQRITEEPLARCKFCHGKVEKLISQSSFQFKGSGWYLTDYARKSDGSKESSKKSEGSEKSGATNPTAASSSDKGSETPGKP